MDTKKFRQLMRRAERLLDKNDIEKAIKTVEEGLGLCGRSDYDELAEAENFLGDLYDNMDGMELRTEHHYLAAINYRKSWLEEGRTDDRLAMLADDFCELGGFYFDIGKFNRAMSAYTESLNCYKELYGRDADKFGPELAMQHYNMALTIAKKDDIFAKPHLEEALELFRAHYGKTGESFMEMTAALSLLAFDYIRDNDYDQALALAEEGLDVASESDGNALVMLYAAKGKIFHKLGLEKACERMVDRIGELDPTGQMLGFVENDDDEAEEPKLVGGMLSETDDLHAEFPDFFPDTKKRELN